MSCNEYIILLVLGLLTVLPIIAASLVWLLIDPQTAWEKMGTLLVCGFCGTLVFVGEMLLVMVLT